MTSADVIFVLPVLEPAGAERIVAELARRLPQHGFVTSVVCLEDERAPVGAELAAAGIPVRGLRLSRRRTLACASALAKILSELRANENRPLILHAHLFHANIAARLAYAQLPKPARENIHVLSTIHVAERRFRPWQFALDRVTARHARAEVCVSRAVAAFQQERTGLPREFFRVIENGIDLARFSPSSPLSPGGRGAGGPGRLGPMLSVGRLDPQKDYPTLLRAWKVVAAARSDVELAIAGDGPEAQNLKDLAASLGLTNVTFLGFVKDIPALLRGASLYVQPSAWEGFGLAVAEAMACALPVVVSDADSLPEVVTHEKTGLVVPKGNPELLAAAILRLLNNPKEAEEFAQAAETEARHRFSVERMAADYARLYQEILSPKSH